MKSLEEETRENSVNLKTKTEKKGFPPPPGTSETLIINGLNTSSENKQKEKKAREKKMARKTKFEFECQKPLK